VREHDKLIAEIEADSLMQTSQRKGQGAVIAPRPFKPIPQGGTAVSYTRFVTLARQIDLSAILLERAMQIVMTQ
jgi:hypothetical protein